MNTYDISDWRATLTTARNYLLCALIPAVSLLWGVYFLHSGDEMGFSLLHYYLLLPLNAFLSALLLARGRTRCLWFHPLLMGAFALLLPYSAFGGELQWFAALLGVVPSLLGLGVLALYRLLWRTTQGITD